MLLETYRHLPSTLCAAAGPSVNLRQLCMQLQDLPSTSVTFLCFQGTVCQFHQFSVKTWDLPSTSIHFPCSHGTFRQRSFWTRDIPSTSFKFPCCRWTFRQLLSSFRAAWDLPSPSIAVPCRERMITINSIYFYHPSSLNFLVVKAVSPV